MRIAIGCDHGGLEHKNAIKDHFEKSGFTVIDSGIYTLEAVDYPDIAIKVCSEICKLYKNKTN